MGMAVGMAVGVGVGMEDMTTWVGYRSGMSGS